MFHSDVNRLELRLLAKLYLSKLYLAKLYLATQTSEHNFISGIYFLI
jgi:hypothetical protein